MNKIVAVIFMLLIVSCSAHATQVRGPDGSMNWFVITCSHNQSECLEKAGQSCNNGYHIANNNGREVMSFAPFIGYHTTYNGEMMIKCK